MSESLPTEGLRVKYGAKNPVVRRIVDGFLASFDRCVRSVEARRVLEAGCGEGFLTRRLQGLLPEAAAYGLDSSAAILEIARREFPELRLLHGSIYDLPFRDEQFDLVVACEVLEHVEEPERALAEVARCSARHVLLSVPREPVWRVLNVLRGKYWGDWGNTPGHLQHWRPREFEALARRHLDVQRVLRPFPWTMLLCSKR
jgi:SAM-dependent methyltransferase